MFDVDMKNTLAQVDIPLERDGFLRQLLRHLSGSLQDLVGLQEAEGFISTVGQKIGEEIDTEYKKALGVDRLPVEQVSAVLVDLKRRIQGDFYVVEETDTKIVLRNRKCPFGDKVLGRESLCMMTTNVFGVIAAENLGYARVQVNEAIARGHSGCAVTIHLQTGSPDQGVEFFRVE